MLSHCLTDRHEDDSLLCQLLLERRLDRHRVHDSVHSGTAQREALLQGDAKLVEGLLQLRVDLFVLRFLCQRIGIIGYCLEVDRWHMDVPPRRNGQGLPITVGLQTKVEQPLRLAFLLGYEPYNILVQTLGNDLSVNICRKAVFIFLVSNLLDEGVAFLLEFYLHNS